MPRKLVTFHARWEIDIEAPSATHAALAARRLQVAALTTAVVFDVWPRDGPPRARRIDLLTLRQQAIEPAAILRAMVEAFPGLLDGESSVNGGDLVQFLTIQLRELTHLEDIVPERSGSRPL